jgi:hypothetical protein
MYRFKCNQNNTGFGENSKLVHPALRLLKPYLETINLLCLFGRLNVLSSCLANQELNPPDGRRNQVHWSDELPDAGSGFVPCMDQSTALPNALPFCDTHVLKERTLYGLGVRILMQGIYWW